MITTAQRILLLLLLASLSGCFTVRTVDNAEDYTCNLVTRELEVHVEERLTQDYSQSLSHTSIDDSKELLFLLIAVPITSYVVAGSVAVTGNMVHWIEKQGKCDDSAVHEFLAAINTSLTSAGGIIIDSYDDLTHWLQAKD